MAPFDASASAALSPVVAGTAERSWMVERVIRVRALVFALKWTKVPWSTASSMYGVGLNCRRAMQVFRQRWVEALEMVHVNSPLQR